MQIDYDRDFTHQDENVKEAMLNEVYCIGLSNLSNNVDDQEVPSLESECNEIGWKSSASNDRRYRSE
jgi:hypothetical protein